VTVNVARQPFLAEASVVVTIAFSAAAISALDSFVVVSAACAAVGLMSRPTTIEAAVNRRDDRNSRDMHTSERQRAHGACRRWRSATSAEGARQRDASRGSGLNRTDVKIGARSLLMISAAAAIPFSPYVRDFRF